MYLIVPKQFYKGQLGSSNGTLYTAPTLTINGKAQKAIIKELWITNTDSTAHTYTLYVVESGGSVAANRKIFAEATIAANTTHQHSCSTVLETGATLQGLADAASKITVIASGVELL